MTLLQNGAGEMPGGGGGSPFKAQCPHSLSPIRGSVSTSMQSSAVLQPVGRGATSLRSVPVSVTASGEGELLSSAASPGPVPP